MRYFDHAATTPILDEVLEAMLRYLKSGHDGLFGNPSSVYAAGRDAKKGLEEAREQVAVAIGAQPSQIVFTAGGTEADNMALKGVASRASAARRHIVISAVEHHAVLHSAEWLERQGFRVTVLPVDRQGVVDLDALASSLGNETVLVSIMMVNNETGAIQPVADAVRIVRERSTALFHTDAVQALGKVQVDVEALGVDLASFSAHKIGGPKGTGALYIRRGSPTEPILHGGGQERDLRSGTPNVAGIAGFGVAAQIAAKDADAEAERLAPMRDRLQHDICTSIERVSVNAAEAPRIPGTLSVNIEGVEGESLLLMLDAKGIAASSGSACTSGSLDPSHVLMAMGLDPETAHGSLRISMGRDTTADDVAYLTDALPPIVERLRSIAPSSAPPRSSR